MPSIGQNRNNTVKFKITFTGVQPEKPCYSVTKAKHNCGDEYLKRSFGSLLHTDVDLEATVPS